MQKYADYIKEIEIESLWSGQRHVVWQLDRRVNVLSGVNGVGVLFGILTVVFVLPSIVLIFEKQILKYRHRSLFESVCYAIYCY